MKTLRKIVEKIDELLDSIPSYEEGQWYRQGGYGCRWRLSRFWYSEADENV